MLLNCRAAAGFRGQTSIEAMLIFAVVLSVVLLLVSAFSDSLTGTATMIGKKEAEHYKKKIEQVAGTVCELGSGSAIRIELGNAVVDSGIVKAGNAEAIIQKKINGCEFVAEGTFRKQLWIQKQGGAVELKKAN